MSRNNNYKRDGNNDRPPRNQHQQKDNNHRIQENASQHPSSASDCYNQQRVILSDQNLANNNDSIHNPSQSFLTSQEPRQTIIHQFYNSLNQPLSISSNAITDSDAIIDGNAINSNSAMSVTYINNRLVLHTSPLHSNFVANDFRRNEPISFTTNQPNTASNTASVPFHVSRARMVNPPMTIIHPPSQHNQQQFTDCRGSSLCGNVSSQLNALQPFHSSDASAMRIVTNTNQNTAVKIQVPFPQYTSTNNEMHVHRNRSIRSKLIVSSNVRDENFNRSNDILAQADIPIKSSDDDVCSASSDSSSDFQRKRELFPFLLYRLLIDAESNSFTKIVSFLPHGRAFAVHSRFMFEEMVMPMYFSNKQFSSFRRQLNLYDFVRMKKAKQSDTYYHLSFVRGSPDMLSNIRLTRTKGSKKKLDRVEEPNFDQMEPALPIEGDKSDKKMSSNKSRSSHKDEK